MAPSERKRASETMGLILSQHHPSLYNIQREQLNCFSDGEFSCYQWSWFLLIVIVNTNKTLWWTQFCLSDASTKMTNFWILLSARIFKPSHNTLQYLKSLFLSKLYLIRQNEKTKTAIISGKVGPNISANQYYKHEVLPNDALRACVLSRTVVSYSLQLHRL